MAQGLVNGAVLHPEFSFPALIAEALGLRVGPDADADFVVPSFFDPGIPFNIEKALLDVEFWNGERLRKRGETLRAFFFAGLDIVRNRYYFETKSSPGKMNVGPPDHLAISGLSVRDCIELTPEECDDRIGDAMDSLDAYVSATATKPLLRIAKVVVNGSGIPERQTWSPLTAFAHHFRDPDPTDENPKKKPDVVVIHLGNADILGAVADLKLNLMPGDFDGDRGGRERYNVTHPDVFRADYQEFGRRVDEILSAVDPKPKVLIGNLPPTTIAPFIRGFGRQDENGYFECYARFFMDRPPAVRQTMRTLSREEVIHLDKVVDSYNETIKDVANAHGWHLVDVWGMVNGLAIRRRFLEHEPERPLANYLQGLVAQDGLDSTIAALGKLVPPLDVRVFRSKPDGTRAQGGLFGFDCGHPSTFGYALVADLFLRKMRDKDVAVATADDQLNWNAIINERAKCMQTAPHLWEEVVGQLERHPVLFDFLFSGRPGKFQQKLAAKWREFRG